MANITMEVVRNEILKYIKNNQYVEVVIRDAKKRYAEFIKLPLKDLIDDNTSDTAKKIVHNLIKNKDFAKLKDMIPNISKIFNSLMNPQLLGYMNMAMNVANLTATMAGIAIICQKLDHIEKKLDEIDRKLDNLTDKVNKDQKATFETQLAHPCRELLDDYKKLGFDIQNGEIMPEKELIELIKKSKNYIYTLYNNRNNYDLIEILDLIFTMVPVMANSLIVYYQHYYKNNGQKMVYHEDCIKMLDLLSSDEFMEEIQDYLFIDLHQTNKVVNEHLDCQRMLLYGMKNEINQVLEDIKTCDGLEGYNEAISWSRQYAAQQLKAAEAELIAQYGKEKAEEIIKPVKQAVLS